MNEMVMEETISNLRDRAYFQENLRIDQLNQLDEIIFENSMNVPEKKKKIDVDKTNISLTYIQNGIDISSALSQELSQKYGYIKSLYKKHQECLGVYTRVIEVGNHS